MAKNREQYAKLTARQRKLRYSGRKAAAVLLLTGSVAALMVADHRGVFGRKPAGEFERYHDRTFRVTRIFDGDTIEINAPDGDYPHTRVRFWGVDTPETHHPTKPVMHFGPEAGEYVKSLLRGKSVRIELEPNAKPRGKRGRLLGWIYLSDGRLLNALLVAEGYGYADPRFKHLRFDEFRQLQSQAMKERKGLWKDARQQDMPYYYSKLKLPE